MQYTYEDVEQGWRLMDPMTWNRCIFFLFFLAFPVLAQDTALDELEHEMVDLVHQTKEELIRKIQELTEENRKLQQQSVQQNGVRGGSDSEFEALQRENGQLKKALRALATENAAAIRKAPPAVEAPGQPDTEDSVESLQITGFAYEVIKEWGRSPQVAARLPNNALSMKGMAVYFSEGLENVPSTKYAWFGTKMKQYTLEYDNVIIECFSTRASAEHYAKTGKIIHSDRVLSMSRQQGSKDYSIIGFGSKGQFVVKNPV